MISKKKVTLLNVFSNTVCNNILLISIALSFLAFCSSRVCASENRADLKSVTPLELAPLDAAQIEKDRGFTHALQSSDGSLVFLGQTFIWRWYPLTGTVSKVAIVQALAFQQIVAVGLIKGSVIILMPHDLLDLDIQTGKVKSIESINKTCTHGRIFATPGSLTVVSDCGNFRIQGHTAKLIPWLNQVPIDSLLTRGCTDSDEIYFESGKSIYQMSPELREPKIFTTLTDKSPINGIQCLDGFLVVSQPKGLLVFGRASAQLTGRIPAASDTKISEFYIGSRWHIFAMDSGHFEVMDMESKQIKSGHVRAFSPKNQIWVEPGSAYVVFLHTDKNAPPSLFLLTDE
jgi:hypothetical protein